ncbi:cell wall metabolism sensor histidine kinase WalK [Bacillus sp. 2205SS5-2]|uniref:cell wall metabolism sensor histidine kinase WalK n=1 Tax=Bacillus sp. 2205SS5-2 TaxID=3109031 RepID=UPI003003ADCE
MNKVGFFRSIQLKFVLIYVLLIFLALQIISVYFVQELEDNLLTNFKTSITERVNYLEFTIREEMLKSREEDSPSLEQDLRAVLDDFADAGDISEIRIVDNGKRIIAASNQEVEGFRMTDDEVSRTLAIEKEVDIFKIDRQNGDRLLVYTSPIFADQEMIGVIYLIAKVETVYKQMSQINEILATGTAISLVVTAIIGVFLAQTITKPISDMKKQAQAMTKGNFSRKVKVYGNDEIGQLATTFNSLTKRLQEAQATTEGERRKLSSVLSYMTDGVIATDRKGRVILINDPAAELLSVSREAVLSQSIVALLGLDERYTFDGLLNEQDSVILDYSTEEHPYILRANFSVIQKETGFVNGLITVLHDITEQEKIDMERREFVANVSHELRTPLTTMRSYLEALAEGAWRDTEIAPRFLDVTQTETERMIRLVNDLLQLSKLDSRDYRINQDWINFVEFFDRIIDRFELSKEQNVVFIRELPSEKIFVEIDPDKLTQVIDNIISNALKYSPEGGTVTFKVKKEDSQIRISVSDEGLGIPKDNVEKVFERFYRVDKARSRQMGGTGLGLAIAKEMILAHGGNIWATSKEGKGTKIYFTLPYADVQEDDWI